MYPKQIFALFTMALCLVYQATNAQEVTTTPADNSLSGQFTQLKENAESYKKYKVIDRVQLDGFWVAVQDSISGLKTQIVDSNAKIGELQAKIEELDKSITEKDGALAEGTFEKEHIKVIGIDIAKGTYIGINFSLIFILVAVLAFFIYKYNNSNKITAKSKHDFGKLDKEFENFKKEALEKQMKLRRELQTERNKVDELYQKVGSVK